MERLDLLESSLEFWESLAKEVTDTSFETGAKLNFDDFMNPPHGPGMSRAQLDFEVPPESSGNKTNSLSDSAVVHDPDLVELDLDEIFIMILLYQSQLLSRFLVQLHLGRLLPLFLTPLH